MYLLYLSVKYTNIYLNIYCIILSCCCNAFKCRVLLPTTNDYSFDSLALRLGHSILRCSHSIKIKRARRHDEQCTCPIQNSLHKLCLLTFRQGRSADSPMDFEWTNPRKSSTFAFGSSFTSALHKLEQTTPTKKRIIPISNLIK